VHRKKRSPPFAERSLFVFWITIRFEFIRSLLVCELLFVVREQYSTQKAFSFCTAINAWPKKLEKFKMGENPKLRKRPLLRAF
jgi:hypothetical protein